MTKETYDFLIYRLREQLKHCHGFTGKRKEGFKDGILVAMSMLHGEYERNNNLEKN